MKKITWLRWGCSVVDDDILMSWYFISHIAVYTTLTGMKMENDQTSRWGKNFRIYIYMLHCTAYNSANKRLKLFVHWIALYMHHVLCSTTFFWDFYLGKVDKLYCILVIFLLEAVYFVTGWMSGWKCTLPLMLLCSIVLWKKVSAGDLSHITTNQRPCS